jgi:hypothetical protein
MQEEALQLYSFTALQLYSFTALQLYSKTINPSVWLSRASAVEPWAGGQWNPNGRLPFGVWTGPRIFKLSRLINIVNPVRCLP